MAANLPCDAPGPRTHAGGAETPDPEAMLRLVDDVLAVLHAVEEGALLGEPPCGREARRRHQAAVVLIDIVREKLERLRATLEACERRSLAAGRAR